MARYLAIPKNDSVIASLNLADISISPDSRESQLSRVIDARRAFSKSVGGANPVKVIQSLDAKIISHPEEQTSITGIMVFDLEDRSALELVRNRLPEYEVIQDLPLSLIQPKRSVTATGNSNTTPLSTWHQEAIKLKAARSLGFEGRGAGVGVAILDTGIAEVDEIDSRVKSAFEWDKSSNRAISITTKDTEGHGTHVAGLVAGKTVGIAPEADLMNFIMIPGGHGYFSDFIFAIEFVARRPEISVLNMSAGIPGFNSSMKPAIGLALRTGILPVIAIGNEGDGQTRSPGNYAEVVSVGASTRFNKVASLSSSGELTVDSHRYSVPLLVAPGQGVSSCVMSGGYEAWDGTSMAAPIVSGVAALIIEKVPNITLPDLKETIIRALQPMRGEPTVRQGKGLLQLPTQMWQSMAQA